MSPTRTQTRTGRSGVERTNHEVTAPPKLRVVKALKYNKFSGMPLNLKERNISNKHNGLKNPNWWEADQLAICKCDRGVELGSTEKQFRLSNESEQDLNPRALNFKTGTLITRPHCLPQGISTKLSDKVLKTWHHIACNDMTQR